MSHPNDLSRAFREILNTSRHYYVLGFEPPASRKKASEPRRIEIRVDRPHVEVSHRTAYTLPDPRAAAAPERQLQAAEAIAKGLTAGPLRLQALAVPYRNAAGRVSLPVVLEVDGESLLAGGVKDNLGLEVYGYAVDGSGRIQDAVAVTPTLELQQVGPTIRQKGMQIITSFQVADGPVDLRFLVREPASGRSGSLRVLANVPRFEAASTVVSVPLLMDDPRTRVILPAASRRQPELEIPFRLDQTPFIPQTAPRLRNGEASQACVMVFGGAPGPDPIALSAVLVGAEAQSFAVPAGATQAVADADGAWRLVVTLTPDRVPAGAYRLRIALAGDAALGHTELPVWVE